MSVEYDTKEFVSEVKAAYEKRIEAVERGLADRIIGLENWLGERLSLLEQSENEKRTHLQAILNSSLSSHIRENELMLRDIGNNLIKLETRADGLETNTIGKLEGKVLSLEAKIQELQNKVTRALEEKASMLEEKTQELRQYQNVAQGKTIMLSIIIPIVVSLGAIFLNYILRK
jgi:septin family protein